MNKVSECGDEQEEKGELLEKGAVYLRYDEHYMAMHTRSPKFLLYSLRAGNIWSWDAKKRVPEGFKRVPKGTCIKIITE